MLRLFLLSLQVAAELPLTSAGQDRTRKCNTCLAALPKVMSTAWFCQVDGHNMQEKSINKLNNYCHVIVMTTWALPLCVHVQVLFYLLLFLPS